MQNAGSGFTKILNKLEQDWAVSKTYASHFSQLFTRNYKVMTSQD